MRGEWRRVIDGLLRGLQNRLVRQPTPGVRIPIEAREIAAGDLDPDTVPFQEHVARDTGIDGKRIDLAGPRQLGFFQPISIANAQNAVREIARFAVGKHIH